MIKLTPREREMLELSWFDNPAAAEIVGIATKTVSIIRGNLYEKIGKAIGSTGYTSRTETAWRACCLGIIEPDDFIIGDHPGVV